MPFVWMILIPIFGSICASLFSSPNNQIGGWIFGVCFGLFMFFMSIEKR